MDNYCKNKHLKDMEVDILYHLAIDTRTSDLKRMFGNVKYVVMGGSPTRMEKLAYLLLQELDIKLPAGHGLVNISGASDRYALFKAGPILCVSHGMGVPSISILLHEIIKLVDHAGCRDVTFLRLGTSGGLGLRPGTVVISDSCMDGLFRPYLSLHILGKTVERPAVFDETLVQQFKAVGADFKDFEVVSGKTLCANDFYEEQARLDGAVCHYSMEEKMAFLRAAHEQGVCNIEMESLCFAATCHHLGIKAVVICVAVVDRLKGDQIEASHEDMQKWQERPALLAAEYFRRTLGSRRASWA